MVSFVLSICLIDRYYTCVKWKRRLLLIYFFCVVFASILIFYPKTWQSNIRPIYTSAKLVSIGKKLTNLSKIFRHRFNHFLWLFSFFIISAKFEENEENIPTIHTLNSFVHHVFSTAEFHQMELLLLNFFCWNLDLPTPVNFMEYYLVHAISPQDCQSGKSKEDCSKPMTYTRKYVHYFLEIALQGMIFENVAIRFQ